MKKLEKIASQMQVHVDKLNVLLVQLQDELGDRNVYDDPKPTARVKRKARHPERENDE